MRLSTLLQVGAVSTLVLSPAMAQQVEDVHQQALKILREQTSSGNTTAATAPSGTSQSRAERQLQLEREAAARRALRDQQQAEKRKEFQTRQDQKRQDLKDKFQEREQIRQQQRTRDEQVARDTGLIGSANPIGQNGIEDVHARALAILRGETAVPASNQAAPAAATLHASSTPSAATFNGQITDQTQSTGPTPETRERVRQILNEQAPRRTQAPSTAADPETRARETLRQKASETADGTTNAAVQAAQTPAVTGSGSIEDIHRKALQVLHEQTATSPASVLDPKLQQMIQRQDAEVARTGGANPRDIPAPKGRLHTEANGASSLPPTLSSDAEQRARELLRHPQTAPAAALPAVSSSTTAPVTARPAGPATTVATTPAAPATSVVQPAPPTAPFSRDVEERARQILRERAQGPQQPTAATQPSSAAPSNAAQAAVDQSRQAQPNNSASTVAPQSSQAARGKRERLEELNMLYRGDKLTPAEYHERRAKILAEP